MGENILSAMEIDAIGEILNISLGASATAVSTMLDARVDITTPVVNVVSKDEFSFEKLEPAVGVEITYVAGLEGKNVMLLKKNDVRIIVDMLMGTQTPPEEFELDEMSVSAICEVMNQMMGASSTALSELLGRSVNISTPRSTEVENAEEFKEKNFEGNERMVVVHFVLNIADQMESEFVNLMPLKLAKELVSGLFPDELLDTQEEAPAAAAAEIPAPAVASQPSAMPAAEQSSQTGGQKMSQDEIDRLKAMAAGQAPAQSTPSTEPASAAVASTPSAGDMGPASAAGTAAVLVDPPAQSQPAASTSAGMSDTLRELEQMQQAMLQQMQMMQQMQQQTMLVQQQAAAAPPAVPRQINVHAAPAANLYDSKTAKDEEVNMDLVLGVPVEVSVEIGRTRKYVKDVLELNKGSLVVLDKLAGEQVDLFVNGQCIAKGDVVVVDDNFGIRITEILHDDLEIAL